MTVTADMQRTDGPSRVRGRALLALCVMSAMRLGFLLWGGAGWVVAGDLLLGAALSGWLFRERESAAGIVATAPAWVVLAATADGAVIGDAVFPAAVTIVWLAGLAWCHGLVQTPHSRSRIATSFIALLLSTLVLAYIVGSAPSISPIAVSPLFVGFRGGVNFVVFPLIFALFPLVVAVAWWGRRRLSTSHSG
ncbi:MAG: hypothetical protein AAGD32_03480 [Planctomycetota bacterium]